jgi:hypothetical protein
MGFMAAFDGAGITGMNYAAVSGGNFELEGDIR